MRSPARRARSAARRLNDARFWMVQRHRWGKILPPGVRPIELAPAILGVDPARASDLGRLLRMSAAEVAATLGREGAPRQVTVAGATLTVRPGTADVFTIDDTFGVAYHRSLWDLREQPVIVDLGANVGLTMVDYGLSYPDATIIGVELDVENVKLARRNTEPLHDATVIHAGIAAVAGTVTYGLASTNAYAIGTGGDRSAPALTVADVMPDRQVDLLKMDIEGAEQGVLAAGEGWAERVDHILVETHPPYSREMCVRDLQRLGLEAAFDVRHPAGVAGSRRAL